MPTLRETIYAEDRAAKLDSSTGAWGLGGWGGVLWRERLYWLILPKKDMIFVSPLWGSKCLIVGHALADAGSYTVSPVIRKGPKKTLKSIDTKDRIGQFE